MSYVYLFSVAKATLQPQMSVRSFVSLSVWKQNPQTALNQSFHLTTTFTTTHTTIHNNIRHTSDNWLTTDNWLTDNWLTDNLLTEWQLTDWVTTYWLSNVQCPMSNDPWLMTNDQWQMSNVLFLILILMSKTFDSAQNPSARAWLWSSSILLNIIVNYYWIIEFYYINVILSELWGIFCCCC